MKLGSTTTTTTHGEWVGGGQWIGGRAGGGKKVENADGQGGKVDGEQKTTDCYSGFRKRHAHRKWEEKRPMTVCR